MRLAGNGAFLLGAVGLLVLAARIGFTNLSHYSNNYDEGVYLESVRLMRHGYPLYRAVFASQPPLWFLFLDASFSLFGESVRSGRLVTVAGALLAVGAVILAGQQLRGRLAGSLAGALVMLSPFYLLTSRSVEAESPSTPLAALGVALVAVYFRQGRRVWWFLAVLAVTAGVMVKLFAVYAYAPLALLAVGRWWTAETTWHRRLQGVLLDAGLAALLVVGICAAFALALGPGLVWNQVVTFHVAARGAYQPLGTWENARLLYSFLKAEPLLVPAAPLALLCLGGGWRGLAAMLWLVSAVTGAVGQHPLFDHHSASVIPPLALAIGVGWGQLPAAARALFRRARERQGGHAVAITGAATVFSLVSALSLALLLPRVQPAWLALGRLDRSSGDNSVDVQLAGIVDARTVPGDSILTDQQTIAFWAQRDVPPGLTDTSFVRIASHYLTADQVIRQSTASQVKVAVLASGRLRQLPAALRWVEQSFPHHLDLGQGRVVYWK